MFCISTSIKSNKIWQ